MSDPNNSSTAVGTAPATSSSGTPGNGAPVAQSYSITPSRTPLGRILKIVGIIVLVIALVMLPLYLQAQWLSVGTWIMTGAVGGMGLTMLVGQAGQLSLAHTFFLLVGGVAYSVFAGPTDDITYFGLGLPPLLALILAVAVAGLAGALFAPISGRLSGIYLGVASLALVFLGFWLGRILPALAGSTSSGRSPVQFSIGGLSVDPPEPIIVLMGTPLGKDERKWYLFLILTIIAFLLARGALKGRTGRAWRAVRDNEAAATVLGVSVIWSKAGAFAISSMYAGLAGVMTVWWYSLMKPDESEFGTFGVTQAIAFLAMIVIGGLGSLAGSIAGSVVVFGLPLILSLLTQGGSGGVQSGTAFSPIVITNLIYGALVVLIMMFEPRGLAGIGNRLMAVFRK